jgi:hypothetical protein
MWDGISKNRRHAPCHPQCNQIERKSAAQQANSSRVRECSVKNGNIELSCGNTIEGSDEAWQKLPGASRETRPCVLRLVGDRDADRGNSLVECRLRFNHAQRKPDWSLMKTTAGDHGSSWLHALVSPAT